MYAFSGSRADRGPTGPYKGLVSVAYYSPTKNVSIAIKVIIIKVIKINAVMMLCSVSWFIVRA